MSKRNRRRQLVAKTAKSPVLGEHAAPVRQDATVAKTARGNNRWDALAQLQETAELERSVQARRHRQVLAARRAGASWTSIAQLLGVSPQAVQKRYGRQLVD